MERDFLGFKWEEISHNNIFNDDSVNGMQWWSSNKYSPSSQSQFQGFEATQKKGFRKFPFRCEIERSPLTEGSSTCNNAKQLEAFDDRLTIIYDNKVYVFEDISPDKAEAIMRLAEEYDLTNVDDDMKQVVVDESATPSIINSSPQYYFETTLPQARQATMEHFLKKRKHRLSKGMFYNFMKMYGTPQPLMQSSAEMKLL